MKLKEPIKNFSSLGKREIVAGKELIDVIFHWKGPDGPEFSKEISKKIHGVYMAGYMDALETVKNAAGKIDFTDKESGS